MKTTIKIMVVTMLIALSTAMSGQIYTNANNSYSGCDVNSTNTVVGTYGYSLVCFATTMYGGGCNFNTGQPQKINWAATTQTYGALSSGTSGAFTGGAIYHTKLGLITNSVIAGGSINGNFIGNILCSAFLLDTGLFIISRQGPSAASQTMHSILCPSVIPTPTASIPNVTLCAGLTYTFNNTSTPGNVGSTPYRTKYIWNSGTGTTTISPSSSPAASVSFTYATPNTPGSYTVSLTAENWSGPNNKTSTYIATVTVVSNPTLSANSVTVCAGSTVTLTVNGNAANYVWSGSSSSVGTQVIIPAISSNKSYTILAINGQCTATTTAQVQVNSNPTVSASNFTSCAGSAVTLSATGASTYSWSSGQIVSPTANTSYTVTGTTNGCTATAVSNVSVNQLPVVSITGNQTVCLNSNLTLTANGASTYSWSDGSNTQNTVFSSSTATTTVFTVTGFSNSCSSTASHTVQAVDCNTTDVGIASHYLKPTFKAYPNPTAGMLNVEYTGHLEVFDMGGKMVMSTDMDGSIEIDLAPGLYVLRFDGVYNHKVIKQ